MMILLAAGVKKSLMFNHLMNAINLAAWVFLMSAGLFYVNLDNWTKNDGFLPNGWGGVSSSTFCLKRCVKNGSVHQENYCCVNVDLFLYKIIYNILEHLVHKNHVYFRYVVPKS